MSVAVKLMNSYHAFHYKCQISHIRSVMITQLTMFDLPQLLRQRSPLHGSPSCHFHIFAAMRMPRTAMGGNAALRKWLGLCAAQGSSGAGSDWQSAGCGYLSFHTLSCAPLSAAAQIYLCKKKSCKRFLRSDRTLPLKTGSHLTFDSEILIFSGST